MADYTDDQIEEQAQRNVKRRREFFDRMDAPRPRLPSERSYYDAPRQQQEAPPAGPVTILRGGREPETVQKFRRGGMVRKHGSPTDCGPMCRDSKTVR